MFITFRNGKLASTTCIIETYRDCPAEVFDNNVDAVPLQTQVAMMVEQWQNISNGAELCGL